MPASRLPHGPGPVLCIGELLWDELPDGRVPGGAPFNVAAHLVRLGQPAALVTRVGADPLAEPLVEEARRVGVDCRLVQRGGDDPTGTVSVTTDAAGQPAYEIRSPAAWDRIEVGPREMEAADAAAAIVFGSLAQRGETSRASIARLRASRAAGIFDVNLRPPHVDAEIVAASLTGAAVVKLNEGELLQMIDWFGLPPEPEQAARALAERFGCGAVCVTAGAAGAGMLREGRWSWEDGVPVEVVDTVGAGDAFLAALLCGLLRGDPDEQVLRSANREGAWVAGRRGAVPPRDEPR